MTMFEFEETPVRGVRMKVVGVATTHKADKLLNAHRIVHELAELTVKDLQALAG